VGETKKWTLSPTSLRFVRVMEHFTIYSDKNSLYFHWQNMIKYYIHKQLKLGRNYICTHGITQLTDTPNVQVPSIRLIKVYISTRECIMRCEYTSISNQIYEKCKRHCLTMLHKVDMYLWYINGLTYVSSTISISINGS
jgi:hypothetical protein